jgi:hypothetical protein
VNTFLSSVEAAFERKRYFERNTYTWRRGHTTFLLQEEKEGLFQAEAARLMRLLKTRVV